MLRDFLAQRDGDIPGAGGAGCSDTALPNAGGKIGVFPRDNPSPALPPCDAFGHCGKTCWGNIARYEAMVSLVSCGELKKYKLMLKGGPFQRAQGWV